MSGPVLRLKARTRRVLKGDVLLLALNREVAKLAPFGPEEEVFLHAVAAGGTRDDVREQVVGALGDDRWDRFGAWFDELARRGFLERLDVDHGLDPADVERFDRMLNFLSELEREGLSRFDVLRRLRDSRVAIVGTGGLASWVLYNLTCCGVGHVRLFDDDVVAASNLNRSILYSEDDVGQPKVEAARRALLRFAPRTEVEAVSMLVSGPGSLLPHLDGVDLVIATADQPPWLVREWVASACHDAKVPLLHPSGCRVGPFHLPGTACPMCDWAALVEKNPLQPELVALQRRLPASDSGALSYLGTLTAGMTAMEAFRHLTGELRPLTVDGIWEMDPGTGVAGVRPTGRHPRCPVCGDGEDLVESPSAAVARLDRR